MFLKKIILSTNKVGLDCNLLCHVSLYNSCSRDMAGTSVHNTDGHVGSCSFYLILLIFIILFLFIYHYVFDFWHTVRLVCIGNCQCNMVSKLFIMKCHMAQLGPILLVHSCSFTIPFLLYVLTFSISKPAVRQ